MANFNWVDYVILAIFFLSLLAGLMRGFVKEVIGLITWLAAFVAAIMFSTRLATAVTSSSPSSDQPVSLLATSLSFICIFIGVLILGKLIGYVFSRAVEGGGVSFMNRLLGAIFGLARGFLTVIIIMFLIEMTALTSQSWWKDSQLVNTLQPGVQWLATIAHPDFDNLKEKMSRKFQDIQSNFDQKEESRQ